MGFGKIETVLGGKQIQLDVDQEPTIQDLSDDMDRVAAQIAFWGELWGAAEGERVMADARYRAWAAQLAMKLQKMDGMSEWKVKARIEADPGFIKCKEAIAKTTRDATVMRAVFDAFKSKASMLQSKGARARAELEATGMATRSVEKEATRQERVNKLKNKNQG